ncbi:AAA family ATPase [Enterococcus asini]|uniref:AAA family ATPase n=1 Tax=Enterococcus asini TaxID=57732 RepID=UPI000E494CAF|nr:AAA family ATPase [Enterococcus asini]RGW12888.1 ATP-binding cassette domain-containing protein [Enterococcus asini]
MYLKAVKINSNQPSLEEYPFSLPIIKNLLHSNQPLPFSKPITFLAGENGSGKSTLLEGIALALGMHPEGGTKNFNFSTYDSHSELHEHLTLVRQGVLPKTMFFLRAESYYNLASTVQDLALDAFYGNRTLHELSHGEGVLSIVTNRFTKNGLYLLDEPESGLSVSRQMTLLKEIITLSQRNCQFIIATHSPVLLAATQATIYQIKQGTLQTVNYHETDAYQDMKLFIDDPERMLYYLLDD